MLRAELISELTALRTTFQDIAVRYQANLEAQIVTCINTLSSEQADELPEMARDEKQLQAALHACKNMPLKPQKGRLKDLRKIHSVVTALVEQLAHA